MQRTFRGSTLYMVLATAGMTFFVSAAPEPRLLPHRDGAWEQRSGCRGTAGQPGRAMVSSGREEAPLSASWSRDEGTRLSSDPGVHGATRRVDGTDQRSPEAPTPAESTAREPLPEKVCTAANPLFMMNPRFVVAAEHYDFNGESGGPSHYSYDGDGRLVEKIFERSDGLRTVTTYEYDDNCLLISSHRAYADGGSADFRYSYDGTPRLTGKTFRRSDGAEGFEHYVYDGLGRLATATYRNMDFWLNGTIVFRYDGRGHLTGGRFSGEDGFDADLEIRTDIHGNVVRVHWVFSFGKTQTYTLGYRPV